MAQSEPIVAKLSSYGSLPAESFTETTTAETTTSTVNEDGVINMPDVVEDEPVAAVTDTVIENTTEATVEAVVDNTVSSFEMPSYDEPAIETTEGKAAEAPITDWREAIKTADRKELLKELGIDDFAIELNEHIKNGGQASDYLNAKARDWNSVPDLDIIRDEFKAKFPNLTAAEIERKISRKYSLDDIDDDLKADGEIDLKSDAYELRQSRIERDKKLIIPSNKSPEVDMDAMTNQFMESQQRIQQENYKKSIDIFNNHEATKELNQSKRVALDLGANGKFSFTVDKPEVITKAIYDSKFWSKITSNEKGEPNVKLLQKLVLHAINEQKFENDLVNYGKSLGLHNVVAEGQNAKRPIGSPAKTDTSPVIRQGTYGRLQTQN